MTESYILQKDVLISGMKDFVKKYRDVTFKFEFDKNRTCFLVSYNLPLQLLDEEDVWNALFSFKSDIRNIFGDYAPIFMEGESICKLSSNAQVISFERLNLSSEDSSLSNDSSLQTDNSFISENPTVYTFSIGEEEVCFFDGYQEYISAA